MTGENYVRHGIHPELEAEADEWIRQSLKGVTARSAKSDILTPWKEQDRKSREVYVPSGVPDPSERQGMFHRSYNPARPELNSRDGISRAAARTSTTRPSGGTFRDRDDVGGSLADFVVKNRKGENEQGEAVALDEG